MNFVDIPIRQNGQNATADWWNDLRTAGIAITAGNETITKYTFDYSDLAAASLTNDIELFELGIKYLVKGVIVKHTTAFSGGAIATYNVNVGISGNLNKYAGPFDVFQAVGDTVFSVNSILSVEDFGSTTSIRLQAVSTGANLDQATQGEVDVYVIATFLP